MEDMGEYMVESKEKLTSSCKLTVNENEKRPVLNLENTDFQGDAGKPLSIEIPYSSKNLKHIIFIIKNFFNF